MISNMMLLLLEEWKKANKDKIKSCSVRAIPQTKLIRIMITENNKMWWESTSSIKRPRKATSPISALNLKVTMNQQSKRRNCR